MSEAALIGYSPAPLQRKRQYGPVLVQRHLEGLDRVCNRMNKKHEVKLNRLEQRDRRRDYIARSPGHPAHKEVPWASASRQQPPGVPRAHSASNLLPGAPLPANMAMLSSAPLPARSQTSHVASRTQGGTRNSEGFCVARMPQYHSIHSDIFAPPPAEGEAQRAPDKPNASGSRVPVSLDEWVSSNSLSAQEPDGEPAGRPTSSPTSKANESSSKKAAPARRRTEKQATVNVVEVDQPLPTVYANAAAKATADFAQKRAEALAFQAASLFASAGKSRSMQRLNALLTKVEVPADDESMEKQNIYSPEMVKAWKDDIITGLSVLPADWASKWRGRAQANAGSPKR